MRLYAPPFLGSKHFAASLSSEGLGSVLLQITRDARAVDIKNRWHSSRRDGTHCPRLKWGMSFSALRSLSSDARVE